MDPDAASILGTVRDCQARLHQLYGVVQQEKEKRAR